MKSDLFSVCEACVKGTLKDNLPVFDNNKKTLGVVVVSKGYPEAYKKGLEISGKKHWMKNRTNLHLLSKTDLRNVPF